MFSKDYFYSIGHLISWNAYLEMIPENQRVAQNNAW